MRLNRAIARRFCDALATSDQAIFQVLKDHPELPPWKTLRRWRDQFPWFSEMWRKAREEQGEHLAQKCLDLAAQTTPKNAHAMRVKYDVFKWVASRFAPAVYGDKPTAPTTNVIVGVSISAERLNEIRSKLDITRAVLNSKTHKNGDSQKTQSQTQSLPLDTTKRLDTTNTKS